MISKDTTLRVKNILDKYIPDRTLQQAMLIELLAVPGNQSYKDSINNLKKMIQNEKTKII